MTGARILLVEDEAPIRRFLRIALEAKGYAVSEAATARDGIRLAALDGPAAMVLDLGLPDADGLAVLRAVRAWSAMPVLVLSVRADEAGKVAALAFANTQTAAAAAATVWMLIEWIHGGKPTILGFASGMVAGLVVITPCAGHVLPWSSIVIGALGGGVKFFLRGHVWDERMSG